MLGAGVESPEPRAARSWLMMLNLKGFFVFFFTLQDDIGT